MRRRALLVVMLFLAAGLETRSEATSPAVASPIDVELQFDGGYAFIFDQATGALTVGSFGNTADHAMRLQIRQGTYSSGPTEGGGTTRWNLGGADYAISFPHAPKNGVLLPRQGTVPSAPCDNIAAESRGANAMYLFPNITRMAMAAGSDGRVDRKQLDDQVTLEGGALWLRSATSCFSIVQNAGYATQRVTAGLAAVRVSFEVPGTELTINLRHGNTTDVLTIKPNADNKIVLGLGRLDYCTNCDIPIGSKLPMFDRYFDLFAGIDAKKLPVLIKVGPAVISPGDECPPGWFEDPPPSEPAPAPDHHQPRPAARH